MPDSLPANNSLHVLPEGVIELTQTGHQTAESVSQFQAQIDDMTTDLHAQGKKVLILVDLSGVTGQEPEVLGLARDRLKGDYDALALVGNAMPVRMIVNWLVHAAGNDKRLRSFENRDEALAWLLSHD